MKFQALYCALVGAAAVAITALAPVDVADAARSKKDPKPAATRLRAQALTATAGTPVVLSAVLTQKKGGAPIAGEPVTFLVKKGTRFVKAGVGHTDGAGSATLEVPFDGSKPRVAYKAKYVATEKYLASSASAAIQRVTPEVPRDDEGDDDGRRIDGPPPCPSGIPRGTLNGYVTVDGSPARYAEVRIGTGACGGWDAAGGSGAFEMKLAPAGRKTVSVKLSGSKTWRDVGPVEIIENQTLSVELVYSTSPSGWEILPR